MYGVVVAKTSIKKDLNSATLSQYPFKESLYKKWYIIAGHAMWRAAILISFFCTGRMSSIILWFVSISNIFMSVAANNPQEIIASFLAPNVHLHFW